jgi:hypothetical protein
MRSSLAQHHGALLMCCGWILHWKDLPESGCRQVTIGNPTFKAPNPFRRFDKLELVGKEEHVNLFIPYKHLATYDARFLLSEKIFFCGFVQEYTRRDGSCDYGIASIAQNPISRKIEKLNSQLECARSYPSSDTLSLVEGVILTSVEDLTKEIHDLGDHLPTFIQSKGEMLEELKSIQKVASCIRNIMNSRQYRRKCAKKSKPTLHALVGMYF